MTAIVSEYFAWASPTILPAMASAAMAALLIGWWRGHGPIPQSALNMILPVGAAVVLIVALSAVAALFGLEPVKHVEVLGILAGTFSGVLLAPRRA